MCCYYNAAQTSSPQTPHSLPVSAKYGVSVASLTHWGRATHICVGKLTIIGSGNGLSPGRRQAIIWTNAGILLIGPLGTNFREIFIGIQTFSFKKMHLKMSSAKWRLFASASMNLIYVLLLSSKCCMWYCDKLNHIIMALHCNMLSYLWAW